MDLLRLGQASSSFITAARTYLKPPFCLQKTFLSANSHTPVKRALIPYGKRFCIPVPEQERGSDLLGALSVAFTAGVLQP